MDKIAARSLFDTVVKASVDYRREQGEIPMSFIFVLPDGRIFQLPPVPGEDGAEISMAVRSLAVTMGARYVLSVGEAWISSKDPEEGIAPSEDPERIEAVMVTIDGPDLRLLCHVEIKENGSLGEPEISEDFGGRFTDLSASLEFN